MFFVVFVFWNELVVVPQLRDLLGHIIQRGPSHDRFVAQSCPKTGSPAQNAFLNVPDFVRGLVGHSKKLCVFGKLIGRVPVQKARRRHVYGGYAFEGHRGEIIIIAKSVWPWAMEGIAPDDCFVLIVALARLDAQGEGFDQVGWLIVLVGGFVPVLPFRWLFFVYQDRRGDADGGNDRLGRGLDGLQGLGDELEGQGAARDEGTGGSCSGSRANKGFWYLCRGSCVSRGKRGGEGEKAYGQSLEDFNFAVALQGAQNRAALGKSGGRGPHLDKQRPSFDEFDHAVSVPACRHFAAVWKLMRIQS